MNREVRAYLKVHGGPAPQSAPSPRFVETTAPTLIKSCCSWCGNGGWSLTPAMWKMRCRVVVWMTVI